MDLKPELLACLEGLSMAPEETAQLVGLLETKHASLLAQVSAYGGQIANIETHRAEHQADADGIAAIISKLSAPETEDEGEGATE